MRIVFLIGVNDIGGAEYVAYQHVMMATRNGHDVTVGSGTDGMFYNMTKDAGVKAFIIGMGPTKEVLRDIFTNCDIVFNCNHFGALEQTVGLKQKFKFSHLMILHSNIDWVMDQAEKWKNGIDLFYSIHQKITDTCITRGLTTRDRIATIANCVDLENIKNIQGTKSEIRKTLGYNENQIVIGMITRVSRDKNIMGAIGILKRLPNEINARLLIVGGPAESANSKNYHATVLRAISTMGLKEKVQITGNLKPEDVYRTMRAFDIGLNTSPSEGLPIALLEMMAIGIPCVMPGIGDIADVLTGRGVVVGLRQRVKIDDIFKEPCYTLEETNRFIVEIVNLARKKQLRLDYGNLAEKYIKGHRSLEVQEKEFLKFLDMGTKKKKNINSTAEAVGNSPFSSAQGTVSVLMPTRDGNEVWAERAIRSILEQDYKGKIDFVIVNHNSRLGYTHWLMDFIAANIDPTGNVLIGCKEIRTEDLTFSEALDQGISMCSGDIVVRMDCDDIAEPGLISSVVGFLNEHRDIDVVGVQLAFFGAKEMTTKHPSRITKKEAFEMSGYWFVNHPGAAIRKEALLRVGGYGKTKTGFAEDYHLWCKILKSGGVIANLPDALVNYRCYAKSWRYQEGLVEFLEKEKKGLKG